MAGEWLAAIEASAPARALRFSRWGYAAVSASHVLGIALLVGASMPLALRLLGLWPTVDRAALARVLVPVAACGLGLAVASGVALLAPRASGYLGVGFLQAKLVLVTIGTLSALYAHARHGRDLAGASRARARLHGAVALACWLGALACGRLIAFAAD